MVTLYKYCDSRSDIWTHLSVLMGYVALRVVLEIQEGVRDVPQCRVTEVEA